MDKILTKKMSFILLIVWLGVIFVFSNMNGVTSYALSENIVSNLFSNVTMNKPTIDIIHLLFRKFAHIFEYFVLSFFAYNYLKFYIHDNKKLYITVCGFSIACSVIDELHQLFIIERLGKPYDVLIDSIGVIIFLIIVIIYNKYVASRKSN